MTPVQQVCIALTACDLFGGFGDPGIAPCVRQLTTSVPEHPYLAAQRARLIAALPGGCAAMRAAFPGDPMFCPTQCTLTGGTCAAGSNVCSNLVVPFDQTRCSMCSDASTYVDCDGTRAFAVTCPSGTRCSANIGCVQTAVCDVNASTTCSGTDRVTCNASNSVAIAEDCAGRGGTCDLSSCVSTQIGDPCNELTYGTRCDGPYIKSCALGKIVYADCRALGHPTCVAQAGGGNGKCID
jgi:hypothetical protein